VALGPGAFRALLQALVDCDFVTIDFPLRPIRPDEARPEITLTNPAGQRRTVGKWAGDRHAGFERVYQALLEVARQAQAGPALYDGAYDADFAP
jgi:hypothetical protein